MVKAKKLFKLGMAALLASSTFLLGAFANQASYFVPDSEAYSIAQWVTADDWSNRAIYDLREEENIENWLWYAGEDVDPEVLKSQLQGLGEKTVIYIPEWGGELFLPDSGELHVPIFSLRGYSNDTPGDVPEVNQSLILTKSGEGILTVRGDNSWYNGMVNIEGGGILVDKDGALFGGDINLLPDTSLIVEGGAKDPYNRPRITMAGNSSLLFSFDNIPGENNIFSVYGSLKGEETSRLEIEKGVVMIKGDCSGFTGEVHIASGAEFFVRSKSDDYTGGFDNYRGALFGGTIFVEDDDTNDTGIVTISANSGLEPLVIQKGTVIIKNDLDSDALADNPIPDVTPVEGLTIEPDAAVIIEYGDTNFTDTNVRGKLELAGGEKVEFGNLDIDGGILNVSGLDLGNIKATGEIMVGSSLIGTGGVLDASEADSFEIYEGREFIMEKIRLKVQEILSGLGSSLNIADSIVQVIKEDAKLPEDITAVDSTILGDGSAAAAGDYDDEGNQQRFLINAKDLKVEDDALRVSLDGLREYTIPRGQISFEYTTDEGKTWNEIKKAAINRESEESLSAQVEITWEAGDLKNYQVRAYYIPGENDNYDSGEEAISEVLNPSQKEDPKTPDPEPSPAPAPAAAAPAPAPSAGSSSSTAKTGDNAAQGIMLIQVMILALAAALSQMAKNRKKI